MKTWPGYTTRKPKRKLKEQRYNKELLHAIGEAILDLPAEADSTFYQMLRDVASDFGADTSGADDLSEPYEYVLLYLQKCLYKIK